MTTKKHEAIQAFQNVLGAKQPKQERLLGRLGDAAGTVEVPNRENYVYVRLSGASTRTVRALNMAVRPEVGRYVDLEINQVAGQPKFYRVIGYSDYEFIGGVPAGSPTAPPVYPGGQSAAEKVVVWTAGTFFTNEKMHNVLTGAELHKNVGTNIEVEEIATATYDDLQDWINSTQSAGRISGGGLTQNVATPSTLDVGAGAGFIKITNSDIAVTKFFDWNAAPAEALADGQTNYIYVNYNIATTAVTVEVTVDRLAIPVTNAFTLGRVYRDGDTLHIIVSGVNLYNYVRMAHRRLIEVRGFERASGGDIAESGQRYLTSTDGVFYLGSNRLATTGEDTTGLDRFIGWYMDTGAWASTIPQQQIDNLQYNDVSVGGSETLANLTSNRYGVFWAYVHMDGDIQILYGQEDYKLAGAEDALLPSSLPESLSDFGILAAKIIVQQGENNLLSVVSAYTTLFPVSAPDNHNDLGGIQGGQADQYYHLTSTEHGYVSGVNAQSVLTTADPTFVGLTVSGPGVAPTLLEITTAITDLMRPAVDLKATTSGDMVDGFGSGLRFIIQDDSALDYPIAAIYGMRDGADDEGQLLLTGGTNGAEALLTLHADLSAEFAGDIIVVNGATIGQTAGPLLTFDDAGDTLQITGASNGVGIGGAPTATYMLTVTGKTHLYGETTLIQTIGNSVVLIVKAHVDTVADFIQVQDSAGTIVAALDLHAMLALGLQTPSYQLDVHSGTTDIVANFESSDTIAEILLTDNGGFSRLRNTDGVLSLWTAAEAVTIAADGDVEFSNSITVDEDATVTGVATMPAGNPAVVSTDRRFHLTFDGHSTPDVTEPGWEPTEANVIYLGWEHMAAGVAKFGQAVQIAAAMQNDITNPSFEVDTAGWTIVTGGTFVQTADDYVYGDYCARMTTVAVNGSAISSYTPAASYVQNDPYTVSGWIKGVSGEQCEVRIAEYNNVPAYLAYQTIEIITFTGDWQYFAYSDVCAQATCDRLRVFFRERNDDVVVFLIDAINVQKIAYPTPYIDGSLGAGHAWTGAAHASTSTRTAATLTYPNGVVAYPSGDCYEQLTIAGWFIPAWDSTIPDRLYGWQCWSGAVADMIALQYNNVTDAWEVYINGAWRIISAAQAFNNWEPQFVAVTLDFDADEYTITVNDDAPVVDTTVLAPPAFGANVFYVGSLFGTSRWFNGLIDDFVIYPRVLSAGEIATIYQRGNPIQPPTSANMRVIFGEWTSATFAGLGFSTAAWTTLDLVDDFGIPFGAKAVSCYADAGDTGAGYNSFYLRKDATQSASLTVPGGPAAGEWASGSGIIPVANGRTVDYRIAASGAGTFGLYWRIYAVYL